MRQGSRMGHGAWGEGRRAKSEGRGGDCGYDLEAFWAMRVRRMLL